MTDEQRPTANEYKLLEKLAGGATCWRGSRGRLGRSWHVAPARVSQGSTLSVSDSTVSSLKKQGWVGQSYVRWRCEYDLSITDAGRKAYEDEARRRLESEA